MFALTASTYALAEVLWPSSADWSDGCGSLAAVVSIRNVTRVL